MPTESEHSILFDKSTPVTLQFYHSNCQCCHEEIAHLSQRVSFLYNLEYQEYNLEYQEERDSGFMTEAEFEAEKKIFGSIFSPCEGGNCDL